MSHVQDNDTNRRHCRCGMCPVELASKCVSKSKKQGLYCSVGKTECDDFDISKKCICPTCLVWDENNLNSIYYCQEGSADDIN